MIQVDSLSPGSSGGKGHFWPEGRSVVSDLWAARFGTPGDAFDNYSFYHRAKSIWAFSNSVLPNFRYEAVGMRMMSMKEEPWKPTTCALQVFGRHATRNLIHLTEGQAESFMAGKSQGIGLYAETEITPGYVVCFYDGEVLGCGLYSHGSLLSQIPKDRRIQETVP